MVKLLSKPILSINLLRNLTQLEWKVITQTKLPSSPIRLVILSFISLAALLVKVIAIILYGSICLSFIKYAILCISTPVLPEPAPAKSKSGPSVVKTACFCLSFNLSYIVDIVPLKTFLYFIVDQNICSCKSYKSSSFIFLLI